MVKNLWAPFKVNGRGHFSNLATHTPISSEHCWTGLRVRLLRRKQTNYSVREIGNPRPTPVLGEAPTPFGVPNRLMEAAAAFCS